MKYSDSVLKEKLWRQIGEVLKNYQISFNVTYCGFRSYYQSIITKVLIINK